MNLAVVLDVNVIIKGKLECLWGIGELDAVVVDGRNLSMLWLLWKNGPPSDLGRL